MNIAVIIPTIHKGMLGELLDCIRGNTVQPQHILIMDGEDSVNEKWNRGIASVGKDVDLVAILNDDILIKPQFFEAIIQAFKEHPEVTTICPGTTRIRARFEKAIVGSPDFHEPKRVQGWAFVMRKKALDQMPPIPDDIHTYCGDRWLSLGQKKFGHHWVVDSGNKIYHAVGMSLHYVNLPGGTRGREWRAYLRHKKAFLGKEIC